MSEELHEWQQSFTLKGDLVQKDIEALEGVLIKMPRLALSNTSAASKLKAAIEADWIVEPDTEYGDFEGRRRYYYGGKDVDEMHPGAVRWLGGQIDKLYQETTQVPKNL
jgi:hypothetical protein